MLEIDNEIARLIKNNLKVKGIQYLDGCVPVKGEKL